MIRNTGSAVAASASIEIHRLDQWIALLRWERCLLESWMKNSDYQSYCRSKQK